LSAGRTPETVVMATVSLDSLWSPIEVCAASKCKATWSIRTASNVVDNLERSSFVSCVMAAVTYSLTATRHQKKKPEPMRVSRFLSAGRRWMLFDYRSMNFIGRTHSRKED
jgi:hypothetical protein